MLRKTHVALLAAFLTAALAFWTAPALADEPSPTPSASPSAEPTQGADDSTGGESSEAPPEGTGSGAEKSETGGDKSSQQESTEPTETTPPPSDEDEEEGDEADGAREVDDAQFRWGLNNESNNQAFFGYNFFSAGKIKDPGQGATLLPESGWHQKSGKVSIQKYRTSSGKYEPATWDGLKTDSSNASIGGPTSDKFSNHQVVINGGTGVIDRDAGTAKISWKGDFTVVYYSGFAFFYVSNPVLDVADGKGTVTATLSGFGSSMDDMTKWEPLKPQKVTLASLPKVSLTADKLGFEATPAYKGITYKVPKDGVSQSRTGDSWGAFPQSFVDFQQQVGTAAYWYSSGGSTDRHKPTLPLTVSYSAGTPVDQSAPDTSGAGAPSISNGAPAPPHTGTLVTDGTSQTPNTTAPDALEALAPKDAADATQLASTRPVSTVLAQSPPSPGYALLWWVGAVLLLTAGIVALSSALYRPARTS